jgi:hypothetical protein
MGKDYVLAIRVTSHSSLSPITINEQSLCQWKGFKTYADFRRVIHYLGKAVLKASLLLDIIQAEYFVEF